MTDAYPFPTFVFFFSRDIRTRQFSASACLFPSATNPVRLECVHSNESITERKDEIQVVSKAGNNPTT